MLKSNPYVFPFTPFENLENRTIRDNFKKQKKVSWEEIDSLLKKLPQPKIEFSGGTTAEQIFSLFKNDEIRFGPLEFITDYQDEWLEKISHFIKQKKPIQFSLLGFPFKVPVPFKTNRVYPDLGELLVAQRLRFITEEIKKVYQPGAIITVFAEGVFAKFSFIDIWRAQVYEKGVKELIKKAGYDDTVKVVALEELEKLDPRFKGTFESKKETYQKLLKIKDPKFCKKFEGALPSIYNIISSEDYDFDLLFEVYNEDKKDEKISPKAKAIREELRDKARKTVISYFAYLDTRSELDLIEKYQPGILALSVSPKPHRLGIIPIHKENLRLPHHGVPVYESDKNLCFIEYLIDIQRRPFDYTLVFWDQDWEKKPFYYVKST